MNKLYTLTGSQLSILDDAKFENELELQKLLEDFPELLPSNEIIGNPSLFLVQREFPVSTGYIDHLFIDQLMVPTVVETKVNNPEIRRKIIGQGYEYLTSLSLELNGKRITEYAKRYWKDQYISQLQKRLNLSALNIKEIDKNLKKPRLRLIFAADFIPRELRKFVEFINNASRGIDVYAIQYKQFRIEDNTIITVDTWGPTEGAIHDKALSFGLLTREEFINKINQSQDLMPTEKKTFVQRLGEILDLSEELGFSVSWRSKSFNIVCPYHDEFKKFLEIYYSGKVSVDLIPLNQRDETLRQNYNQLDEIFGLQRKHMDPGAKFKLGAKSLFQLSEEEYEYLLSILKSFANSTT